MSQSHHHFTPPRRHLPFGPRGGMGMARAGLTMPVIRAKDFRGTLKRLLTYLKPRWWQLLLMLLLAIASNLFSILSPQILGRAITALFEGFMEKLQGVPGAGIDFQYIKQILLILALLYLASSTFAYLQQFIMAGIAQNTVYDLRQQVSAKLARLPLKFFDSRPHGDTLSRVTNDMDNIATTLQQSITQLITAIVTIVGVVLMMLSISPLLTLITLITIPLSAIVTKFAASRSQVYFREQQEAIGTLNGHVEEMLTGHQIIKAYGHEDESVQTFSRINSELYEASWRAQFISGIIMPLLNFVGNIVYVLISVVGGILVTRQVIQIGDIQAFIQYSRQFSHPIAQLGSIANIIQSTIASAERVFELLDEIEEVPDPISAKTIPSPKGEVVFKNVKFSYRPDTQLIENLNIHAQPGQIIAIVGPTGAGKTTLVNLLMRFYEIDDGSIMVDGVDIRELRRSDLRKMFGMVLQDTWLFNGTIKDNIAYGREGATWEEVIAAAKAAHADHFIRTLPDGYDTMLNEEASNLSQGQKQLITIARAILADPAILILDEATSNVDTRTEVYIRKAMAELMRGRTSFVIAHRLSTIHDADLILVMNNGRVVEQGTHNELIAKGGFYAELYNSQFIGAGPVKVET